MNNLGKFIIITGWIIIAVCILLSGTSLANGNYYESAFTGFLGLIVLYNNTGSRKVKVKW
jgi:hypothetical protein